MIAFLRTRHFLPRSTATLMLSAFVALCSAAAADARDEPVERRISYQGQLQGATGSTDAVFRIYDSTGTVIWGPEIHQVTPDAEGRFVAVIGSTRLDVCRRAGAALTCDGSDGISDLDQIDARDVELEISIGGVALSPRQKLFAAFQSAKASSLEDDVMLRLVPTGVVLPFAGPDTSVPSGWRLCDGTSLDRAQYAGLFAVIGSAHGSDDAATFRLPDYRGRLLRGVSGAIGQGRDSEANSRPAMNVGGNTGNLVGSAQEDAVQTHWHTGTAHTHGLGGEASGSIIGGSQAIAANTGRAEDPIGNLSVPGPLRVATETRVDNAYVNFIIRCGLEDPC